MAASTLFCNAFVTKRKALSSVRKWNGTLTNGFKCKIEEEDTKSHLESFINPCDKKVGLGLYSVCDSSSAFYPFGSAMKNGFHGVIHFDTGEGSPYKSLLKCKKKFPKNKFKAKLKKRVSFGPSTIKLFSELDYYTGEKALIREYAKKNAIRNIKRALRIRGNKVNNVIAGRRSSFHNAKKEIKTQAQPKKRKLNQVTKVKINNKIICKSKPTLNNETLPDLKKSNNNLTPSSKQKSCENENIQSAKNISESKCEHSNKIINGKKQSTDKLASKNKDNAKNKASPANQNQYENKAESKVKKNESVSKTKTNSVLRSNHKISSSSKNVVKSKTLSTKPDGSSTIKCLDKTQEATARKSNNFSQQKHPNGTFKLHGSNSTSRAKEFKKLNNIIKKNNHLVNGYTEKEALRNMRKILRVREKVKEVTVLGRRSSFHNAKSQIKVQIKGPKKKKKKKIIAYLPIQSNHVQDNTLNELVEDQDNNSNKLVKDSDHSNKVNVTSTNATTGGKENSKQGSDTTKNQLLSSKSSSNIPNNVQEIVQRRLGRTCKITNTTDVNKEKISNTEAQERYKKSQELPITKSNKSVKSESETFLKRDKEESAKNKEVSSPKRKAGRPFKRKRNNHIIVMQIPHQIINSDQQPARTLDRICKTRNTTDLNEEKIRNTKDQERYKKTQVLPTTKSNNSVKRESETFLKRDKEESTKIKEVSSPKRKPGRPFKCKRKNHILVMQIPHQMINIDQQSKRKPGRPFKRKRKNGDQKLIDDTNDVPFKNTENNSSKTNERIPKDKTTLDKMSPSKPLKRNNYKDKVKDSMTDSKVITRGNTLDKMSPSKPLKRNNYKDKVKDSMTDSKIITRGNTGKGNHNNNFMKESKRENILNDICKMEKLTHRKSELDHLITAVVKAYQIGTNGRNGRNGHHLSSEFRLFLRNCKRMKILNEEEIKKNIKS